MEDGDFQRRRSEAVELMREMSARATVNSINGNGGSKSSASEQKAQSQNTVTFQNAALPEKRTFDSDVILLLGLLLVLMSENADKALLFALLYILM